MALNDVEQWRQRVVCDPELHHGEPCIRGTGIAVAVIVASLTELTIDELLRDYPQLVREDITAALLYASEASHRTLAL